MIKYYKNNDEEKYCPNCKRLLSRKLFNYHEKRYDKCSSYCKECQYKISRERYLKKVGHREIIKIEDGFKKCSDCKNILPIFEFNKNKTNKDGLQRICRNCQNIREKAYKQTENGKKRYIRYSRSEKGKETNKKIMKKYRKTEKFKKNSLYRNISSSIRHSLKESKKDGSWTTLVEFTLNELKQHIELQFKEGMNWKNYGNKWHIDHIRPIASFNITDCKSNEFKKCWDLKNLQPLWAKENISKGCKWQGKDWRFNE